MDFIETLKTQLDQDQPRWWYDWATGDELRDFARDTLYHTSGEAQTRLRNHIAQRLFHRILNASLTAGIVREL